MYLVLSLKPGATPPLSLVQSPPRFDDLPNLSETDSEDEEEQV